MLLLPLLWSTSRRHPSLGFLKRATFLKTDFDVYGYERKGNTNEFNPHTNDNTNIAINVKTNNYTKDIIVPYISERININTKEIDRTKR